MVTDIVERLRNEPDKPCTLDELYAAADEIERLRDNLEVCKNICEGNVQAKLEAYRELNEVMELNDKLLDERDELREQLAACQRDAERYRWLRERNTDFLEWWAERTPGEGDAVIDSALEGKS